MIMRKWLKKLFALVLAINTLGSGISAGAKVISVDPDAAYQGYTNALYLDTKPQSLGMEYTTNIPSSRLKVYKKDNQTPSGNPGLVIGLGYFDNNRYQKVNYASYIEGWESIGFDITKPTSSDYIQTEHKRVGKINGKWINAKVRYTAFNHSNTWSSSTILSDHSYLDISENMTNGYVYANLKYFGVNATFTYADTDEKVEFVSDKDNHSFLTFSSLNCRYYNPSNVADFTNRPGDPTRTVHASEFATYLNGNVETDEVNSFVTENTNIGLGKVQSSGYPSNVFQGITDAGFEDKLGSSSYKKNSVSFELKGFEQKFVVGAGMALAWNTFSGATLFMNTPEADAKPTKKVFDENFKEINGQEVKKGQTVNWQVSVPVGNMGITLMEKYNELRIVDPLPEQVEYVGYKVTDSKGQDITKDTTIQANGQQMTVSFNQDYLQNKMLYESETYLLTFETKVKNNLDAISKIDIVNTADVYYNKIKLTTNKPSVWVKEDIKNDVKKFVNYDGQVGKTANVDFGKEYSYPINFQVGNEEELTNLVLSDDLADVQTVTKVVVLDDAAKDITDQGTLTVDSKTANVTWKAKKPNDYQGKKLTMTITAKLNDVPELANYLEGGVIKVPNTAKMVTNTKETPSDTTTITPPPVENKAEKFIMLNK